jgi:hypothetical protein
MPFMRDWIIITNKPGQLGNQLALFAHFIAFSADRNVRLLHTAFNDYAEFFLPANYPWVSSFHQPHIGKFNRVVGKIIFSAFRLAARLFRRFNVGNRLFRVVYLDWHEKIDLDQISSFNSTFCLLDGWNFRGKKIAQVNRQIILDYFRPNASYQSQIDKFTGMMRKEGRVLIGIHIRQGDYREFMEGKYFYTIEQYLILLSYLTEAFDDSKLRFAIFSNVHYPVSNFDGFDCVVSSEPAMVDLYCMAACDYIVGPPSTFSSWASFYGNVPIYFVTDPSRKVERRDFQVIEVP